MTKDQIKYFRENLEYRLNSIIDYSDPAGSQNLIAISQGINTLMLLDVKLQTELNQELQIELDKQLLKNNRGVI